MADNQHNGDMEREKHSVQTRQPGDEDSGFISEAVQSVVDFVTGNTGGLGQAARDLQAEPTRAGRKKRQKERKRRGLTRK